MDPQHEHDWRCHSSNEKLLICTDKKCNTVVYIADLLRQTVKEAKEQEKYDVFVSCLRNHWLTVPARKLLNGFVLNHSITRKRELAQPTQEGLGI